MRSVLIMCGAIAAISWAGVMAVNATLSYLQERDNIRPEIMSPSDCIISDRGCGADGYMNWSGTSEKRVDLQIHEMVDAISSTDRFPVRFEKGK